MSNDSNSEFINLSDLSPSDCPAILRGRVTDGQYSGGRHFWLLTSTDGKIHVAGHRYGDDDDKIQSYRAGGSKGGTLIRQMLDSGLLDCEVYDVDMGASAPWDFIEDQGLECPKPEPETDEPTTVDLTSVKGVSTARAKAIVDMHNVSTLIDLAQQGEYETVETLVKMVGGVGDAVAERVALYLDTVDETVDTPSAEGVTDPDKRAEIIASEMADGATVDEILTSVGEITVEDVQNATSHLEDQSAHTGTLAAIFSQLS